MNTIINIALIVWTLALGIAFFVVCAEMTGKGKTRDAWVAGILSFLPIFTAILAIGQYIN